MWPFKKKKTGCETPRYEGVTMPLIKPAKEEYLSNCLCGGKVELDGGTYGYPTVFVECSKCGGRWSMDTYSHEEAIENWNAKMKFYG